MPAETGSPIARNTIGIVFVARLAARIPGGPAVTMMSTLASTSSAASAGIAPGSGEARRA